MWNFFSFGFYWILLKISLDFEAILGAYSPFIGRVNDYCSDRLRFSEILWLFSW